MVSDGLGGAIAGGIPAGSGLAAFLEILGAARAL